MAAEPNDRRDPSGSPASTNAAYDRCSARHPYLVNVAEPEDSPEWRSRCDLRAGHVGRHQRDSGGVVHFWDDAVAVRPGG